MYAATGGSNMKRGHILNREAGYRWSPAGDGPDWQH